MAPGNIQERTIFLIKITSLECAIFRKIGKEWHPKVVLNCDPEVTGKADFGIVDVDKEYVSYVRT